MRVFGVDFTSRPQRAKPIVVAQATLARRRLKIEQLDAFTDFAAFEDWLATPGPWVGGFDFPFGLPRRFVQAHGDASDWPAMVRWAAALGREGFCAMTYPAFRAAKGNPAAKHRRIDVLARSHSPLKTMDVARRQVINPPVGLMFFEGAPRLLDAGLHLPGHRTTLDNRVAVEVYPGWLARQLGVRHYKNDTVVNASLRRAARRQLIEALSAGWPAGGHSIDVPDALADAAMDDATGDRLDAILCAAVAAWAAGQGPPHFGLPQFDPVEGWIAGL